MRGLDIVWMIVPTGTPHPFGFSMFRHDLRVVIEWFMADGTLAVLLGDFLVQQNPHGGAATTFSIASWMVGICYSPNSRPYGCPANQTQGAVLFALDALGRAGLGFPATTVERPVDRT